MARVRRMGLLAALLLALAAPAGAWVETATYDVPGDGVADCLRAAGPGRIALLGAFDHTGTAFDLLDTGADAGSLNPAGSVTLGRVRSCPQVAVADGEPPLFAAPLVDARRKRIAGLQVGMPGGPITTFPTGPDVYDVSLASAPGGAAVLAWVVPPRGSPGAAHARLLAAIRAPGQARFGTPTLLDVAA